MPELPELTREDVLSAIATYERDGLPAGFRSSHTYDLLHHNRRYPPPAIAALAVAQATGLPPPVDLAPGAKTIVFRLLRCAGFRVVPKPGIIPFKTGHHYSRADLASYLGTTEDTTKGDWATGYHLHQDKEAGIDGWWFLFPNVGNAGRTGHDYPNEWLNEFEFRWSGKQSSRLSHPQITSLLNDGYPVLLFTRERDRDRFTYQGPVEAARFRDGPPVEVVWRIEGDKPATLGPDEAVPDDVASELPSDADGRKRVLREIRARRGQQRFRDALLRRYARRCVISGCDIVDLLEAAHIRPYRGLDGDNDASNGLLLRCDLHTLFDLDLVGIEPGTHIVRLHDSIRRPQYAALEGTVLSGGSVSPNPANLRLRWRQFLKRRET